MPLYIILYCRKKDIQNVNEKYVPCSFRKPGQKRCNFTPSQSDRHAFKAQNKGKIFKSGII
jgi:hypothetical protein